MKHSLKYLVLLFLLISTLSFAFQNTEAAPKAQPYCEDYNRTILKTWLDSDETNHYDMVDWLKLNDHFDPADTTNHFLYSCKYQVLRQEAVYELLATVHGADEYSYLIRNWLRENHQHRTRLSKWLFDNGLLQKGIGTTNVVYMDLKQIRIDIVKEFNINVASIDSVIIIKQSSTNPGLYYIYTNPVAIEKKYPNTSIDSIVNQMKLHKTLIITGETVFSKMQLSDKTELINLTLNPQDIENLQEKDCMVTKENHVMLYDHLHDEATLLYELSCNQ